MGHDSDDTNIDIENDGYAVQEVIQTFRLPPARYVIGHLKESESASLDTLAEVVAENLDAGSDEGESEFDQHRTKVALYHVYLPMLDSADIVEFDPEAEHVDLNSNAKTTAAFIELLQSLDHGGSLTG